MRRLEHQFIPAFRCERSGRVEPVHEYPHSNGNSTITGGYVHRGSLATELIGKYIFADVYSGRLWYLNGSQASGYTAVEIADTNFNIAGFGIDNDGEVYVLPFAPSSQIMRFDSNGGTVQDNVPNDLNATGCVSTSNPQLPAGGLVPYAPRAPFFSDNASKDRWLALPNGSNIDVQADGDFAFPTGSVLMKNFSVDNQLVETRLFMRHPDGDWAGYTYQWNNAQTAATRVRVEPFLPFRVKIGSFLAKRNV